VLIGHHLNINFISLDLLGLDVKVVVVRWDPLRYTNQLTIGSL
jgi:uncharacterized membrane protein YqjE